MKIRYNRKECVFMTIDRIKKIREFCMSHYELLPKKDIFSIDKGGRDINGGLNFEERRNYYRIGETKWICESSLEKTIQPPYGQTITYKGESNVSELSDSDMLDILLNNSIIESQFKEFERSLENLGYKQNEYY